MIIVRAKLHRGLLRQAEQKVREIEAAAVNCRRAVYDLCRVGAAENESAACVVVAFRIELNAPEIPAPSPGVLAVVPDQVVEKVSV